MRDHLVRFWVGKEGTEVQEKLRAIALEKGIPVSTCAGVMLVESGGYPGVISSTGAVGLMQVMPCDCLEPYRRYFADRPTTAQLRIPCVNVAWGCEILRAAYLRWGYDWPRAFAAYLGGITGDGHITAEGQHYVDLVIAATGRFPDLD